MLQSLQIWQNFYKCVRICSAFECCKYCRVLKIVQLLQTFFKKKKERNKKCNVAEPTAIAELSNVAVLPMLQILQYLQILKSVAEFYTKKKQEFANVAEPTDVMDL